MTYLIAIALGPVQSFISSARKTRDLYAASWILSEVTKAAALSIPESGGTLIFPGAERAELAPGSDFRAVNKLLLLADTDDPAALAAGAKQAATRRLLALGNSIDNTANRKTVEWDKTLFESHLENFLEFYASWVPHEQEENYKDNRKRAEELLAARKLLNSFSQHKGPDGKYKSSLDGIRETVITPDSRGQRPSDLIRVREKEQLDGIGLLKRFAQPGKEARFDSSIEISGLPYLKKVERLAANPGEMQDAWKSLKTLAAGAGVKSESAGLLFEHESRDIFKTEPDLGKKVKSARDDLHRLCGPPDAPYFAIMKADGDSMGKNIAHLGLTDHQELSRRLSEFAASVRQELLDLECMPIFAGGDDVLAAIPLHRLLEAIECVERLFRTNVSVGELQFTISAGIAIVHALDPLEESMEAARKAEKTAKKIDGKHAVCIAAIPRSGAEVSAVGSFGSTLPVLRDIVRAYSARKLSFGFAHELRELLRCVDPDLDGVLPDLALAIARKKQEGEEAERLIAEACLRPDNDYRLGLEHLMKCMLVTRKLSRAHRDALGEEVQ